MPFGIVEVWNDKRKYGFLRSEDGERLFCHVSGLCGSTHENALYLVPGERVEFDVLEEPDREGRSKKAVNIGVA